MDVTLRVTRYVTAALACWLAVAAAPARAQDPPLRIVADRMSGARGPQGDIVVLEGNLRITRGTAVITARSGRYMRQQGLLDLDDDVRLKDGTLTVTARHANYSELTDVLTLDGDVTLRDRDATMRAPAATYDRGRGVAEMIGGVSGQEGDRRLASERAVWWRDSSLVQARGRVRSEDVKNRLELDAAEIDFRRDTRVAVARGEPVLRARDEDGRITTLRGRLLRVDTARRLAEAIDSVTVERDTLQARADHAVFDDSLGVGWLTGRPRVWDDQTVVTGDSIQVLSERRELQRVVVLGNPSVDYRGVRPTTAGEQNRLTGRRIEMFFSDDDVDSLVALGEARNEYQGAPAAGKTPESNTATGDTITVFFRDRKIDRARVIGEPKGEYRLAVDVADTSAAGRERVAYDADRIVYEVGRNRIVLAGDARMTYRDLELRARRVEFDVDRQSVVARGQPTLLDRGDKVEGQLMTYDLESRIGTIYQAETAYEQGLYTGEAIRKVSDNELHVRDGRYSTCDLPEPHYHFGANAMKIFLKDKLIARPVVFYVKNVPLLALPFWVFPIKPGRHSGLLFPQFEFGLSNPGGQFIRNAGYYWAPNDYMDLQVTGDYYQAEPTWVLRGEGNYRLMYVLDGFVKGSYAKNEGINPREDWEFYGNHSQELTPLTRLAAQAQFLSNRAYAISNQTGRPFADQLDRFLTSSLSLTHNASWAGITAALDRRQDLDADQELRDPDGDGNDPPPPIGRTATLAGLLETMPSLSVSFPTRSIGSLGFLRGTPLRDALRTMYFGMSSRYLSQYERRGFVAGYDTTAGDTVGVRIGQAESTRRALASDMTLRDARRAFGWLNVAPSLFVNTVVWDRDVLGNEVVPSATWRGALTSSATFYGTFLPRIGALEGVRHLVTPSISYSYSPEFGGLNTIDSLGQVVPRFTSFGGIFIGGRVVSAMTFSLQQRLQVKYRRGDKVEKLDNLVSWSAGGSYDFLYRQRGPTAKPFSRIGSGIAIQPPGPFRADMSWSTDLYRARPIRNYVLNTQLNLVSGGNRAGTVAELPVDRTVDPLPEFVDVWSLGLSYSYSGALPEAGAQRWTDVQTANGVARIQFSPAWGFEYATSYDLSEGRLGLQRFSLTRDLHCWSATFTRTFVPGGSTEYYFRLGIKEQREIYIERGTRVGSIGGIQ